MEAWCRSWVGVKRKASSCLSTGTCPTAASTTTSSGPEEACHGMCGIAWLSASRRFALNYLHEELEQCVLHRDTKAANVLLNTNLTTKLRDFGVAELVDPQFRTQTTDVVGTCGYLALEYFIGGKASKESDMFSFGVMALEITFGQRSYKDGEIQVQLHKRVWQLYLAGNVLRAADEALRSGFQRKEMECLMMVGPWCVQPDPTRRPRAEQVIRFLQLEDQVPELPHSTFDGPVLYQP